MMTRFNPLIHYLHNQFRETEVGYDKKKIIEQFEKDYDAVASKISFSSPKQLMDIYEKVNQKGANG